MLPESKSEFPKCLYLDQNKWIDLSRAHYGKPEGEKFKPCLEAVRAAVKSGKLVVPLSIVNAIEAMIDRNEERRKRLAEFMVDLSGNRTVSPEHVMVPLEIADATRMLFGMPATEAPRRSLMQVGILHAAGLAGEFQGMFPPFMNAAFASRPEETVKFLVRSGGDRAQIDAARAGEAEAREIFQKDREATSTMSLAQRQREEMSGLFTKIPEYRAALESTLQSLGRADGDFKSEMKSDEKLARFISSIPNLDVFVTLRIAREKDKDREVEQNDIRDLDWVSVAVPYSNIIVSERYWGAKIRATGLATKYETTLLTNLQDLPDQLTAMGCLG